MTNKPVQPVRTPNQRSGSKSARPGDREGLLVSQLDRELGSADGSKTARPATRKLSKGLSQTAPAAFRPAAEHFGVSSPGLGLRRPSADILKTPRAKPTERIKNVGGGTAAQRQAAARGPTTFSPLVVNLLKQAPSLPFLVGSIQTPKAYVEGGFVITQRGFEQTPSGLEPPFYAQSGPSVTQRGVFIQNRGSGIAWQQLEQVEHQAPTAPADTVPVTPSTAAPPSQGPGLTNLNRTPNPTVLSPTPSPLSSASKPATPAAQADSAGTDKDHPAVFGSTRPGVEEEYPTGQEYREKPSMARSAMFDSSVNIGIQPLVQEGGKGLVKVRPRSTHDGAKWRTRVYDVHTHTHTHTHTQYVFLFPP